MKHLPFALAALSLLTTPAHAQKLGKGGTGVDENSQMPFCSKPWALSRSSRTKRRVPTTSFRPA